MSPMLALRLVTYLLVLNGIGALFLAGLIGLPGAALVMLAILASWWLEGARERGVLRPAVAWGLVATAAVAIAADLAYLASTALDGMVHVLLFLIVARLFMRRGLRDLRDAGFLSFFLLVATSAVTFGMGFVLVFIGFMLLGTWMLMLHHIVAETESAAAPGRDASLARAGVGRSLARMSLFAVAATFAISAILFFLIPRVGQATLPLRTQLSRMVSGFSDRVELAAFGEIEPDQTVIMRVYLPDSPIEPTALPNLRWRGIVFDRFDGRTWAVGRPSRALVRRTSLGHFSLGAPAGRGPVVKQDIYLDPIGTDVVFAAPRALRIDLSSGGLSVDDMGSLSALNASGRLRYQVESELEIASGRTATAGAEPELTPAMRARYLQLPAMSPSILRLAQQVTAGSSDPYDAAVRLNNHLLTRFKYTLAKPQTALDPLDEFLFVRRSGNCEYFAAALAALLRSVDIPARVVGGFQRGDWNPYGRYFMVRMSDAHAWVEAHFPGSGWVTFDPTPSRHRGDRFRAVQHGLLPGRRAHALVPVRHQLESPGPAPRRLDGAPAGTRCAAGVLVAEAVAGGSRMAGERRRGRRRRRVRLPGVALAPSAGGTGDDEHPAAVLRAGAPRAVAHRDLAGAGRDRAAVPRAGGIGGAGLRGAPRPHHERLRARSIRDDTADRRRDARAGAVPAHARAALTRAQPRRWCSTSRQRSWTTSMPASARTRAASSFAMPS